MRRKLPQLAAALILAAHLSVPPALAATDKPIFEVRQLADRIFELYTDGGGYTVKVIVSVGSDGILLVDTGQKETGRDLVAALETLYARHAPTAPAAPLADSPGPSAGPSAPAPRIIINTHSHIEHTGGNLAFGNGPLFIGHENLRNRLRSGVYLFDEFPDEALPRLAFSKSMSLRFNGENIRLIAFPGAHDNSDIIVWFTASKVVCVGALCNGLHFPSVDRETGDVTKYPEAAAEVIGLLPDDVKIIPGHGEDCDMDDFRTFHSMLLQTMEIVRKELAQGKGAATLKAQDVLKDWAAFECSYVNRNQWIDYLVQGVQGKPEKDKKTLFEPMYHAIKDRGVDEAIRLYNEMKAGQSDSYLFDERTPMLIGYKLFENDKLDASLRFFELTLAEYPNGKYASLCYEYAARIHDRSGEKDMAIENFRKCLELDPDNSEAAKRLEELEQ